MSLIKLTYSERAQYAREIRRQIAIVQDRRAVRIDLLEALDAYGEHVLQGFFADTQLLHRLRSAANRLEFQPDTYELPASRKRRAA